MSSNFKLLGLTAVIVAAGMLTLTAPAWATEGWWKTQSSGNWSDSAKWRDDIVPGATAGDIAHLRAGWNTSLTVTMDQAVTLGLLDTGITAGKTYRYTLTGTNALTFDNGGTNAVWQMGTQGNATSSGGDRINCPVTLVDSLDMYNYSSRSGEINGLLTASTSGLTLASLGDGTGAMSLKGGVSGVSYLTQNSAGTLNVGAIALAAGGTTLTNTSVEDVFNVTGAIDGTGDLTILNNSAADQGIKITGAVNLTGAIVNNGTGTGSAMIDGKIASTVTGITQNSTTSTLVLSAGSDSTGTLQINGGAVDFDGGTYQNVIAGTGTLANIANTTTLTGDGSGFAGTLDVTGGTFRLRGTAGNLGGLTSVTVTGSTLQIGDATTANNDGVNDRLGTGASLTIGGANGAGTIGLYGANSGDTTHSLTSLTVDAGYNKIDKLGGGNVMLVFTGAGSSVYTQAGGILDFVDDNVASFTNAPTGSSVSGTGADAILLGALFKSDDFVGAVAGTVAAANYTTQNDASLFAAGTNVVNDGDFTNATPTGATINSLRFGVTSATELVIGSADTDTLDIASGQILVSKNVDADVAIAGPGKLTSSLDLLVFNNSAHTLDLIAPITGAIGLTKAGAGTVSLGAMTSDFTGAIRISDGTLDFNSADTANYANEIAGAGSLSKTGPSTLNLTGNVNVDGTLDVNGGSLVMTGASNSTGGALTVAAGTTADLANTAIGNQANVDGDLTMTGGSVANNANIHSGGTLAADGTAFAGDVNVNSGASAHLTGTSFGKVNASGTVLIDGTTNLRPINIEDGGVVTLDGTPTLNSGNGIYVHNGTFNLVTDTIEGGSGIDVLKAGSNSNDVATVNIGGNIINTSGSTHYDIAQGTDSVVYYNHTAGTVNCNYNNWGGGGDLHGYQSGGVLHPQVGMGFGGSGDGTLNYTITGTGQLTNSYNQGTISLGNGCDATLSFINSTRDVDVDGPAYNASQLLMGGSDTTKIATLNIANSTFRATVAAHNHSDAGIYVRNGGKGVVNVANGSLIIRKAITGTEGSASTLNLNNANLQFNNNSAAGEYNPDGGWIAGFTHTFIHAGGATINTNGNDGTINQVLEGAEGVGVAGVTLTGNGAGYTYQPTVTFTGGTLAGGVGTLGTEAQAIAMWDQDSGTITSIVITNPGQYEVAPTGIVISDGGYSTLATAEFTTASNAGGGLTKTGDGTLTLGVENTYTGDTVIEAGALSIAIPYLDDASTVDIFAGATIDLNFTGTDTIGGLILGGDELPDGVYDSTNTTYGSYFTGTGSLTVSSGGLFGDINGDGVVDAADYIILKQNWGKAASASDQAAACDLDGLGTVGIGDLDLLAAAINNTTGGAVTPEPATLALLAFGGLVVIRRRRK